MTECKFCGEEFDSKRELHIHWGEEHEEDLNSHQKQKVKKAEKEKESEKQAQMAERKKILGYSFAAVLAAALLAVVAAQLINSGGTSTAPGEFNLANQPMTGNPNASVTVVEFGDYRCPYCQMFDQQIYTQLKKDFIETGKVKFYFVNFAFLGPGSTDAAVAGECVYKQDKEQFWDFHHALYEAQGPESQRWVTTDLLVSLARNNTEGLDYNQLKTCINDKETIKQVNSDYQMGVENGVTGTPSVFVNGQKVNQWSNYDVLKSVIQNNLE